MKLGLIIYNTNKGTGNPIFQVNESQDWTRYVKDERNTLKDFEGNKEVIPVVRFLGQLGYIINIINLSKNFRGGDNTTASIFVSAKAEINGETLAELINAVYNQITSQRGLDKDSLNKMFSKDYNEKQVKSYALSDIKSPNNGKFAWRKYGSGARYELSDLLGNNIAQKEYSNYEAIIFVDNAIKVTPNANTEILKGDLKEIVTIYPPINNDSFKAYIESQNEPFDSPIECCVGEELSVVWKEKRYSDIHKTCIIRKEDYGKPLGGIAIEDSDKNFIIHKDWFKVYDDKRVSLDDYIITINGKPFQNNILEIAESALKYEVKLVVKKGGYKDYSKEIRIHHLNIPKEVTLYPEVCSKVYTLPKDEGNGLNDDAKITIETKGNDTQMPLKGYVVENSNLKYKNSQTDSGIWNKILYFVLGAVTVIVIGLMVTGINEFADWYSTHNFDWGLKFPPLKITEKNQDDYQDAEDIGEEEKAKEQQDDELSGLKEYLNKDVWEKKDLDSFEQTKGLFDVMNHFNIQGIIDMLDKDELKNVENVKNLVEAAKERYNDTPEYGTYNNDDDFKIKISKYIKRLKNSPTHKEQEETSTGKPEESTNSTKSKSTTETDSKKSANKASNTNSGTKSQSSGSKKESDGGRETLNEPSKN